MFKGEIAAAIMGNDMPDDPRLRTLDSRMRRPPRGSGISAKA